jgi:hypothetical protein
MQNEFILLFHSLTKINQYNMNVALAFPLQNGTVVCSNKQKVSPIPK